MGGEVKSAADMEVMFDMSKKEQGNPSNNFKKLHRRIKQDFKVSTNKDIISLERLRAANLVIFGGPREMFSSDEFTAIKDYLSEGGSILFLLGEGGEGKSNTNVNYLLEEFGISINNDAVVSSSSSFSTPCIFTELALSLVILRGSVTPGSAVALYTGPLWLLVVPRV
eukprot:s478_g3.t1